MNFDLRANTILLTIGGSRAYGINRPDSDVDVRGVCLAPIDHYIGILGKFEQADAPESMSVFGDLLSDEESSASLASKLEGTVYELRKFISLAADNNPNSLDSLFCDDEHVRLMTSTGKLLRDNRNLFLSSKVNFTLRGYAAGQLKRIRSHRKWLLSPPRSAPVRKDFGLPETGLISNDKLLFALDLIKKKTDSWEINLSLVPHESDRLQIMERISHTIAEIFCTTDSRWKCAARASGMSEEFTSTLEKERAFRSSQDEWNKYNHWKSNRNPERARLEAQFGYDLKHASHLYRLAVMAKEALTTGDLHVNRRGIDAEDILAIRNGAWSYETLETWFSAIDLECQDLYNRKGSPLPHHPDMAKINNLCISIVERHILRSKI